MTLVPHQPWTSLDVTETNNYYISQKLDGKTKGLQQQLKADTKPSFSRKTIFNDYTLKFFFLLGLMC